MARVSIIIATHNRAGLLPKAIESAKNAGTDVEVIVVDDASTDGTASTCREIQGIDFIRLDRNGGPSQARNAGIHRSTADFVSFLDDDDLRVAGSIDQQAKLLVRNENLGFVYGPIHVGNEHCIPTGVIRPLLCRSGDIFWPLLKGNFIYLPSVLVRKKYLKKVGLFDPTLRFTEDWDLWLRLAAAYNVDAIEEPVAVCRGLVRGHQRLSSNRPMMCAATAEVLTRALQCSRGQEIGELERRSLRVDIMNSLWDDLVTEARCAISAKRFRYAAQNYLTAMSLHPKRAFRLNAVASLVHDVKRSLSG